MNNVFLIIAILLSTLMVEAQSDPFSGKSDSTMADLNQSGTTEKHDFDYSQQTYNESKRISHNGMMMAFVGAAFCGAGIYLEESGNGGFIGAVLFFGGGLMANAGIPIWISSGIKAANNRKALDRCRQEVTLSFGQPKMAWD